MIELTIILNTIDLQFYKIFLNEIKILQYLFYFIFCYLDTIEDDDHDHDNFFKVNDLIS